MSTVKREKLTPDTSNSTNDAIEVGRDHDLDDSSKSKSEDHTPTPIESVQVDQQDHDVRQVDPMKIESILERVFDFCSVESLKNCRLVSTAWRDESLKAWRNKAVLQCTTYDPFLNFKFKFKQYLQLVGSDECGDDNGGDDDTVKFRRLKKYPFKRFSLCLDFIDDWKVISSEALRPVSKTTRYLRINVERTIDVCIAKLKNFLSNFHSLKFLHFQHSANVECFDPEQECKTDGFLDFKLQTVKRLEISHSVDAKEQATRCWEYALMWFPNLEALSIKYDNIKEPVCLDNLKSILKIVKNVRQSGGESVLALKELELLTNPRSPKNVMLLPCTSQEIIQLILACNFPLERLSITFGWEMIYQLLDSCKDTLQYLEASFEFDGSFIIYKQQFEKKKNCSSICMAKLKEAIIGNGYLRAADFLTLLELPFVQKLTIGKLKRDKKVAINYSPSYWQTERVYERLETLEILDTYSRILPNTIYKFAKKMPNLLHLTVPLDKEMFRVVCEEFHGLRTLNILPMKWSHLYWDELDDISITYESEVVRRMLPNITHLGLLTDLQISCDWKSLEYRVGFTDYSVIHGFLHLPRLYSLSIAFKDLSEDIKNKLLAHVKGHLCIQQKPYDDDDSETDSDE